MSDRNTWKIIATLIGLGAIGVGIWLYEVQTYREGIRARYRAMQADHLGTETWEESLYDKGQLSFQEQQDRKDARRSEARRFLSEYSEIIGNP